MLNTYVFRIHFLDSDSIVVENIDCNNEFYARAKLNRVLHMLYGKTASNVKVTKIKVIKH